MNPHNKLKSLRFKLLRTSDQSERQNLERQIKYTEQEIENYNRWVVFAMILAIISILVICNT